MLGLCQLMPYQFVLTIGQPKNWLMFPWPLVGQKFGENCEGNVRLWTRFHRQPKFWQSSNQPSKYQISIGSAILVRQIWARMKHTLIKLYGPL